MRLEAHHTTMPYTELRDSAHDGKVTIASIHPASTASIALVMRAIVEDEDGRSDWMWVRLPNGDLILGVFPQGDTYFAVEDDAHYREGHNPDTK